MNTAIDKRKILCWFEEMLEKGYLIDLDEDDRTIVAHFPMEAAIHAPFTITDLVEAMR